MSEEKQGITFFRLKSDVEGDVTMNGSLGASDIDGNFYFLREMLIQSAYTAEYSVEQDNGEVETTAELVLTRVNGKSLHIDLTPFLPNFEEYDIQTSYDPVAGELEIALYKDGEVVAVDTITGIITDSNFKRAFDDAIDFQVIKRVLSDDTIKGIGTKDQLLGVSPLFKNGQMEPAKAFVDITIENNSLPTGATVGEYYVVKDFSDEYGKLYPYSAVKKIQLDLDSEAQEKYEQYSADTSTIGWRVPCANDWDDMLNAVELEYAKSIGCVEYDLSGNAHSTLDTYPQYTHDSQAWINYACGYIAGRLLRSKSYWSGSTENKGWECGEDYIGTDSYGFRAEPVGYAMIDEILLMHNQEGSMWIAGEGGQFSPKSKLHQYDYIQFYGKGNAKTKTFISSGKTDGAPANCVRTDLTSTDSFRSIRLVKEYDGGNYHSRENVLNRAFSTVLLPSLTAENGYKVWTVENFDIDYLEDGKYRYGSKPTINDKLSDADKFKHYYLAYKNENNWEYRELTNGESVVIAEPVYSGDNAYDEYRLINGELVNKTADEFAIYNRIADVELNLEQLKRDYVKTVVWAWGAIDDVTKLASGNSASISALSENLVNLSDILNDLAGRTQEAIEGLEGSIDDLYRTTSGSASIHNLLSLSAEVYEINANLEALSAKETSDYYDLDTRVNEVSGSVESLSGVVVELSGKVNDLTSFIDEHKAEIESIPSLSGDLYQLSGEVQSNYDELVNLINSKVSRLLQDIVNMVNGKFATVTARIETLEQQVKQNTEEICKLRQDVTLLQESVNNNIPAMKRQIADIENGNYEERIETLEDKVKTCCESSGSESEGDEISLDYIEKMIDDKVSDSILTSVTINNQAKATIDNGGITVSKCGVGVNYDFNTNDMAFKPVLSGGMSLDNVIPFSIGGIPCGTSMRELSGMNLSLLLQNLFFPTIYPTIYQKAGLTLTNAEPLLSADITGDVEKDGCYVHKDYIVVELGTNFHKKDLPLHSNYDEDEDAGYFDNAKAYIEADCSKMNEDQMITVGTSGVTYLIKKNIYNSTSDGSNVVYPIEEQSQRDFSNSDTCFGNIGEITIKAEAHFAESENPLYDSNGIETENVYVSNEEGKKVLTTISELEKEEEGQRYNFFFKVSNELNAYISEPIFLINGTQLSNALNDEYSTISDAMAYEGWKKGFAYDEEGRIYPKNGVGSVIAMQKWGSMNAEFNIVTDFVSMQFGVLVPIEMKNISMKAIDTNSADNNQTSNFVSNDVLLDETFSYYLNNQQEWSDRNIPNGFVRYDNPIYISFAHWNDCTKKTICTYYLYIWVGGAQVPTRFRIETKNPISETEEFIENS